LFTLYISLWNR